MTSTSRRNFATGIAGLAILGPLLHLRSASAQEPDLVTLRTPSGRDVTAYLSVPATVPAPAVILLHGGYGSLRFIDHGLRRILSKGLSLWRSISSMARLRRL